MASYRHTVLVLGHSFVRRTKEALEAKFDPRADISFGISDDAIVHLHGKGGRTVLGLCTDLDIVSSLAPDVVILDIGTNDLAASGPEVVGSRIEELVTLLLDAYSV